MISYSYPHPNRPPPLPPSYKESEEGLTIQVVFLNVQQNIWENRYCFHNAAYGKDIENSSHLFFCFPPSNFPSSPVKVVSGCQLTFHYSSIWFSRRIMWLSFDLCRQQMDRGYIEITGCPKKTRPKSVRWCASLTWLICWIVLNDLFEL